MCVTIHFIFYIDKVLLCRSFSIITILITMFFLNFPKTTNNF